MRLEERARQRIFAPPREHGAYGVWSASLAFALITLRSPEPLLLASTLAASLIVLFTLDYMRLARLGGRGPLIVGVVSLLYLPVALARLPESLGVAVLALILLAITLYSRPLTNIAGAALIGTAGSFVMLSGEWVGWARVLFPPVYNLLATSQAQIRVTGARGEFLACEALGAVGVLAMGGYLAIVEGATLVGVLLAVDVFLRLLLRNMGAYDRLSLKGYGILEFIRTLVVQALVATLLRVGGLA